MARTLAPAVPPSTPAQHRPAGNPLPRRLQAPRPNRRGPAKAARTQRKPLPPLPAHCQPTGGVTRVRVPTTLAPGTVLPTVAPAPVPQPTPQWVAQGYTNTLYLPTPAKPAYPGHPASGKPATPAVPAGRMRVVQRYVLATATGLCAWQPAHYRLWAQYRNGQWVYTLATSTTGHPGTWVRCPHTLPMCTTQAKAWLAARVGTLAAARALGKAHQ